VLIVVRPTGSARDGRNTMTTTARLLVLWDTPTNPDYFERHYREVHIPLVKKLPGVRRYTLSRNASAVHGHTYYRIAELDFDDMTALLEAFGSPAGQAAAADVATLESGAGVRVRNMIYELEDI
jgi:uncharacterized protein (TIGR02118 family)